MSDKVDTEAPARIEVLPSLRTGALARAGAFGRGLVTIGGAGARAESGRPVAATLFGPAGILLSFLVCVLGPTAFAGYYFGFVASDVYVSEAKFAVRGSTEKLPTSSANVSMVAQNITALNSNQDAYVVTNYITSVPMLDRLQREENLRALFTRDTIDPLSRLSGSASTEKVRAYWKRMVSASVDSLSGVVNLEVRAYTPGDALALARAIVTASEELVNELSRRRRADALRFANEEVARAEGRVKNSVASMQAFRNQTGFVDPVKSAEAVSKLLATLRGEMIELTNELSTAKASLSANAPSVVVLTARLDALKSQVANVERELTVADGTSTDRTASRALSLYEGLMLEREFSEKFYGVVLGLAETARAEADRQQLYLVPFVYPSLAQSALYPRRLADIALVAVCAFALWSIFALLVAAVRDHDT